MSISRIRSSPTLNLSKLTTQSGYRQSFRLKKKITTLGRNCSRPISNYRSIFSCHLSGSFPLKIYVDPRGMLLYLFCLFSLIFPTFRTCFRKRFTTGSAKRLDSRRLICGTYCTVWQRRKKKSGGMGWVLRVISRPGTFSSTMRDGLRSDVISLGPMSSQSGKRRWKRSWCTWRLKTLTDSLGARPKSNLTSHRSLPSV